MYRLSRTFGVLFVLLFSFIGHAYAATPTIALSPSGDDLVQVRITADPHVKVKLNFTDARGYERALAIGTTNAEGMLTTTVSTKDQSIVQNSSVYLTTPDGAHSSSIRWPFFGTMDISFPYDTLPIALPIGESTSVTVNNPASLPLMVKSNSDSSIARVSFDANTLTVTGRANGTTKITVCTTDQRDCRTLGVPVGTAAAEAQGLEVSASAPVIIKGKTTTLYINGATQAYYVASNSNPSVVQANVSNNAISLVGSVAGSSSVRVCSPTNVCSTLDVTVVPAPSAGTTGPVLDRETLTLYTKEAANILVAGIGGYTVKTNNTQIASTSLVSSSRVRIEGGTTAGKATVTICDSANECAYLSVQVKVPPTPVPLPTPVPTPIPNPSSTGTTTPEFTTYLKSGSSGSEVLRLQQVLAKQGYLKATPNGYFGLQTAAAVRAFQKAHKLSQLGVVGPATRAALNSIH